MLFRLFTYSLETGLYLCAVALCVQAVQRTAAKGRAASEDVVFLGLAAGLAGRARIDFGANLRDSACATASLRGLAPWQALFSAALALAVFSPCFLYLYPVTGSAVPSSGKAELRLTTVAELPMRLKVMLLAIGGHLAPPSYGGMSRLTTVATLVGIAATGKASMYSSTGRASSSSSCPRST